MKERAVRMVFDAFEGGGEGEQYGTITRIARQLDIGTESLRSWVRQAEVDRGAKAGTTSEDKKRITELEKQIRELRRANEILKAAAGFFARELDPRLPR
jgi:transposase